MLGSPCRDRCRGLGADAGQAGKLVFGRRIDLNQKTCWLLIHLIDVDWADPAGGDEIPAAAQDHGDPQRRKRDLIRTFEKKSIPVGGPF